MNDSIYGSLSEKSNKQTNLPIDLFDRFSMMRDKRMLTDLILTSSDSKKFHVHELVMAGSSEYFYEKLLKPDKLNSPDFIPFFDPLCFDIDSSILEMIISFCYKGQITLTDRNITEILEAAGTLKITTLLNQCRNGINDLLTAENCLQFIQVAKENHLNDLVDKASNFIANNLVDVCKTCDFNRLNTPQMNWLLKLLSKNQCGLFDDLLKLLHPLKSELVSLIPEMFTNSETSSIIRLALIVGYFHGTQKTNEIGELGSMDKLQIASTASPSDIEYRSDDGDCDIDDDDLYDIAEEDKNQKNHFAVGNVNARGNVKALIPTGVVVDINKRVMRFSTLTADDRGLEWNFWPKKISVAHDIDTFKDTVVFPIDRDIYVFYIANGNISYVQAIEWERPAVIDVFVPNNVNGFGAALFCLLNDEIYCFSRTEQNSYYKLNTKTNQWSFELIENSMDCKCMVGLNDELYFIACGFHRTIVRSYNVLTRKWTARGGLKQRTQDDCIKAVTLNESIYVVFKSYDHSKIYNQTEFIVQTYDVEGNDWVIVKQIFATHFVDRFYLHAAGYFLYLYHEDSKVYVYSERAFEWNVLPAMKSPLPVSAICIVDSNPEEAF